MRTENDSKRQCVCTYVCVCVCVCVCGCCRELFHFYIAKASLLTLQHPQIWADNVTRASGTFPFNEENMLTPR